MADSLDSTDADDGNNLGDVADLRPFLGLVLLSAALEKTGTELAELINAEIIARLNAAGESKRHVIAQFNDASHSIEFKGIVYKRVSTPPWAPESGYCDVVHELVVVSVKGASVAVCASEPALRDWISDRLKAARPLPARTIEQAFVGTTASAMWLSGAHLPTPSKPTAKALIGSALEDSIDPLGDQTYYYSAVRTVIPLAQTNSKKKTSGVGASPSNGRIWLNRPKNWASFSKDLATILAHATRRKSKSRTPFPALAQQLPDLSEVRDAHSIAVVPMQLLDTEDDALRELAQRWADDSTFGITKRHGPSVDAEIELDGRLIGHVALSVAFAGKVKIEPKWLDSSPAVPDPVRDEFIDEVVRRQWLKIYYENGITVAGSGAYRTTWRDQPFDWTFKDLTGYNVGAEKPERHSGLDLASCIGEKKLDGTLDNSLFGYVVRKAFTTGWLASDDGSMELADFIHIDPSAQVVTLIHAKKSDSDHPNRKVSVAQFEVVVGQAVKNLRHLDRILLADALDAGKDKKIGRAIWHDGKRMKNRSGMIAAAGALPPGYQRRVIVFQPQLTEREHKDCVGPKATARGDRLLRMRQLDTLMLSARLSARAVGGDLLGWGDCTP